MNYTENEFVKINRKILLWRWFSDPCTRGVFIYCLLKANWKSGSWRGIDYNRGDLITTLPELSKELGYSVRSIRTALDHLKSTGEITDKKDHNKRVITICNYDKYQSGVPADKPADKKSPGSIEKSRFSEADAKMPDRQTDRRATGISETSGVFSFEKY